MLGLFVLPSMKAASPAVRLALNLVVNWNGDEIRQLAIDAPIIGENGATADPDRQLKAVIIAKFGAEGRTLSSLMEQFGELFAFCY